MLTEKLMYFLIGCYAKYRSDSSFKGRAVVEVVQARNEEECARYTVKKMENSEEIISEVRPERPERGGPC